MFCPKCGASVSGQGRFCAQCRAPLNSTPPARPAPSSTSRRARPNIPAGALALPPPKNMALAILLAALFGPVGLFYSSVIGGFVMLIVPLLLLAVGKLLFAVPPWTILILLPADVIWAAVAVYLAQQHAVAQAGQAV
jgi:hypothetical protein